MGSARASSTEALSRTFEWPSVKRSLIVAVIIGTILNGINQGDALVAEQPVVVWKLLLTYFVPFAVASYGSYAALR
jgi:TctA family transporter